jgi:hypothetical protein
MYNKQLRKRIIDFLANPTREEGIEIRKNSDDPATTAFLMYQGVQEKNASLIDHFFTHEEKETFAAQEDELNKKIRFELSKDELELLMLADHLAVRIHKEDYPEKTTEYWTGLFATWKIIHDTSLGKSARLAARIMNSLAETWEQYSDCLDRAWECLAHEERRRVLLQKMKKIAETDEQKELLDLHEKSWYT